jgi:hypothetical protein
MSQTKKVGEEYFSRLNRCLMAELIIPLYLVTKSKFSGKRINLSFIKKDLRLFIADFIMFSETSTPTTNDPPKAYKKD